MGICQMYFIDFFLDYEFTSYGRDVLNYTGREFEDRPDPMAKVFPKVTKCTFHLRSFWISPSEGWTLRFAPQHHQRKDLHFCLVLDDFCSCRDWNLLMLPHRYSPRHSNESSSNHHLWRKIYKTLRC